MKPVKYLFIALFLCTVSVWSQEDTSNNYADRVTDADTILETLYAVISGEKGEARDWELFKYLFHPEAKLIPTVKDKEGNTVLKPMTPASYIASSGKWLEENGFFEKEIHRVTESFGPVTHVFSTYESFYSESDEAPFMRGINSIQLLNDGNRWWVVNIYWSSESEANPIPEKYLPAQ